MKKEVSPSHVTHGDNAKVQTIMASDTQFTGEQTGMHMSFPVLETQDTHAQPGQFYPSQEDTI